MSDGDNGGDEGQKKLTDDPAFQELQKAVKGIALIAQQGQAAQAKMQENFNTIVEKMGSTKPKGEVEPDPDDINDLDNMGLMKLVVGEVGKVVDEKLGSVTDSLKVTNQDVSDTKLAAELKEHMQDHPDFMDWRNEIAALAKDNPNLSIPRLHSIVRDENPEKAKELDEKYTDDSEGDKDEGAGFLSLMTTGGGFSDEDSGEKQLTKDEAMDKAWEETVENFPAIASMGDG